ncbi:MAG TPA: hypothetical protein VGB79_06985 [Allosphingosinicella sp.]|jgi:hypothetical protein
MRFEQLRGIQTDVAAGSIDVAMKAADGQHYRFEIGSACVAVLVAALAAEMGKLSGPGQGDQAIVITAFQTALNDQGSPMVLATLESGGTLPLVFHSSDLRTLIGELEALHRTATG